MDYKKEAERWQKNYEAMPFKNGLYAPLFKRSEHETDEEYVKNCEEISTCVLLGFMQIVMKRFIIKLGTVSKLNPI